MTTRSFSPRVWGWSGHSLVGGQHARVFPTRVGMVRFYVTWLSSLLSFPHACGDGPRVVSRAALACRFSPRVWGWSEYIGPADITDSVFPTRVGMVRE